MRRRRREFRLAALAALASALPAAIAGAGAVGQTNRGAYDFSIAGDSSIDFGPGSGGFLAGVDRFTICVPLRRTADASGADDPLLAVGDSLRLSVIGTGFQRNRVQIELQASSPLYAAADALLPEQRWMYVQVIYDANDADDPLRVYLDAEQRTADLSVASGPVAAGDGTFIIGADPDGAESAPARIGSVSIWTDVLSPDDLAELAIGKDPALVRGDALVRHLPFVAGEGAVDVITGAEGVVNGAVPVAGHYVQSAHTGSSRALPASLPRVHANDLPAWAARFAAANASTVRMVLFGDSQETRPGGGGNVMIGRLAYRLHELVGNTPATGLLSSGVTDPWYWNGLAGHQWQGTTIPDTDSLDPAGVQTRTWNQAGVGEQPYPFLARLIWQGENERDDVGAPIKTYFQPTGAIVADVFLRARPGSDGLRVREAPKATALEGGYFQNVVATHVFSATTPDVHGNILDTALDGDVVRHFTTPPFTLDAQEPQFPQVFVDAEHADAATIDLVGVRFRNLDHPAGFVLDSFAAGGYTAAVHVGVHDQCGPLLASQAYDMALIMTGSNDPPHGQARFADEVNALIGFIRAAMDDPAFPIVLVSEAGRTNLLEQPDGAAQFAHQNAYPVRLLEIAQHDDHVLFVNVRRVLEEDLQWIPRRTHDEAIETTVSLYLSDNVHYTPQGAVAFADAFVDEMIPNDWAPCTADLTGPVAGVRDGNVDAIDMLLMISDWGDPCGGGCPSDISGPAGAPDGNVNAVDFLVLIAEWGASCETPCAADVDGPDGASDGIVDSLDYLRFVAEWGTPCRPQCAADITGPGGLPDGAVDALELLELIGQWGSPAHCTD